MTSKTLRFAIGGALALAAASASAFTAVPVVAIDYPISGATATDRTLADVVLDATAGFCNGNNTNERAEVYTTELDFAGIGGGGPTYANYAVVCRTDATLPGSADAAAEGQIVAFRKYSGGSGSGISQVASGANLNTDVPNNRQWVDWVGCRTTVTPQTNVTYTGSVPVDLYEGCASIATSQTKAGISDVEPQLLGATAAQVANLNINAGVGIAFGVPVSRNFFRALQEAQGIDTTTDCPDTDAVNSTPACTPSLTAAQIRGIFKGNLQGVAQLANNSTGAAIPNPIGTNGAFIHVCARGDSSGSQASTRVYFLGQGCGVAGVFPTHTFVGATTGSCTAAGCGWNSGTYGNDRVFRGTGSADVIACLDHRDDTNVYAVGVLSTESTPDDGNNEFRFVRVNAIVPSLENVVSGKYDFYLENTLQFPSGSSPNVVSAGQAAFSNALLAGIRLPAFISRSIVTSPQGLGGILGIPTTAGAGQNPPITAANVLLNPINTQLRAAAYGGAPNSCNASWTGKSRTGITGPDPTN